MGADLYRRYNKGKKVPILGFERSRRAIDSGYFRDPYNNGSVLWKYGLSWWSDITKLQDENGVISLTNVIKFRDMLDDNVFERNISECDREERADFIEGAGLLKDYLNETIKNKDSIVASL